MILKLKKVRLSSSDYRLHNTGYSKAPLKVRLYFTLEFATPEDGLLDGVRLSSMDYHLHNTDYNTPATQDKLFDILLPT